MEQENKRDVVDIRGPEELALAVLEGLEKA